jgi:molecular chaperone GrpE (heat shock protein)
VTLTRNKILAAAAPVPAQAGNTQEAHASHGIESDAARILCLERELRETRDRWSFAKAETAYLRTQSTQSVEAARQFGLQEFAAKLVAITEQLECGIAGLPPHDGGESETVTQLRDAFADIARECVAGLARTGIIRQKTAQPLYHLDTHHATAPNVSAEQAPVNVVQVCQSAWTLHGHTVCPAEIVVSATPSPPGRLQ